MAGVKRAADVTLNPTRAPRAPRAKVAQAWAWEMEDGGLCRWAEVTLEALLERGGPGGWSSPVRVVMMTEREYKKMRRDAIREWRRAK